MALVLNGVKYLVLHQAEEGIFITGCCNKSWTETGTQLVLTAATAPNFVTGFAPCQTTTLYGSRPELDRSGSLP